MTRQIALLLVLCAVLGACGTQTPTTPTTTVTSITLAGSTSLTAVAQTTQLSATANLSSGATQTVTSQASWQSSNPAAATVSSTGLVTAQGFGATTIVVTYQSVMAQAAIAVTIAGTWNYTDPANSLNSLTWTLTQAGSTVTGTFVLSGSSADFKNLTFTGATVTAALNGSMFTWTMMATLFDSDPKQTQCSGQSFTVSGTGQILNTGTMMTVNPAAITTTCKAASNDFQPIAFTLAKQ